MARVLIKDVAALAGTSPATVSKVLNDVPDSGITEETAQRVRWAAEKLRYVPLSSARSLRRRRTETVALVAHDLTSFTAEIVRGVEAVASGAGLSVVLALHGGDLGLEAQHLQLGLRGQVDGMVVVPARGGHSTALYDELSRHNVPFVFVDRYVPGYPAHYVGTRNEEAAYRLTTSLIRRGARVIGGVTGYRGNTALEERWQGFRRAIEEAGLSYDPALDSMGSRGDEPAWVRRLLAYQPRVEGLFWSSYQYIQPVLPIFAAARLRVPDDIGCAGFDPVSLHLAQKEDYEGVRTITGPWTAAIQAGYEIGRLALGIVLQALGGHVFAEPERILLEPRYEWLVDDSTA